jgi:hypothetical protein
MADTNYITHLSGQIRKIVVACYVSGLKRTYCQLRFFHGISYLLLIFFSGFPGLFTSGVVQWTVHCRPSDLDTVSSHCYTYINHFSYQLHLADTPISQCT